MTQVASMGLPVVTELLSPFAVPFFPDILACGVIGALSVLVLPRTKPIVSYLVAWCFLFGLKNENGTDGDLTVAIDASTATAIHQTIVSIDDDGRLVHACSHGSSAKDYRN